MAFIEPGQEPVADRAAFERHAERLGYSVDPDTREGREGGYWSSHTQLMWLTWQAALAEPVQDHFPDATKMVHEPVQEPFGYFRAEPFGWTDCAATDEGATALYLAPPQSKPMPAWLHYCPASDILTIHGRAYSGAAFAAEALATSLPQEQSGPALKPDIARLKEKLRSDPKFALATLQSAGIATPTGKLSKRFKG